MSLYNDVSKTLASKGLTGGISSSLDSALGGVAKSAAGALGGGILANTVANIGVGMAKNAAMAQVNKAIPMKLRGRIDAASRIAGDLMTGDWNSAGMRLLDSGALDKLIPGMGGLSAQATYWGRPTPLFGGLSPTEARTIFEESINTARARKNLFLIEVSSALSGDSSQPFNMFVTDLDYAPFTLTGEKRKVGGATLDAVTGSDPMELRMTATDDKVGTLKRWFRDHQAAVSAEDGTVGVPGNYAVRIKIVHAFVTKDSNRGGYEDIGNFRPANLELSLSRREDALAELQMTFTQLDTFMQA